jgi:hypothetical protein
MNTQSENIADLAIALSKAQAENGTVHKDAKNPFFKSNYASLAQVWETVRPALTANGLSVVQLPSHDESGYYVESMLIHSSGQWIKSRLYMKPVKEDPQGIGSLISYARRYALQSLVMVCSDDLDDDGEMAMGRSTSVPQARTTVTKVLSPVTPKEDPNWFTKVEAVIATKAESATAYLISKGEIKVGQLWNDLPAGKYRDNLIVSPEKFLAAVAKWEAK